MKILIVEDDPFKLDAIRALLKSKSDITIEVAKSLRAAMIELEKTEFDFVLLDMAIPSHTSDAGAVDTYSQPVGGLDVLLFLASESRPERVVILTQHPTIEYNRRHIPLNAMVSAFKEDDITSVLGIIHFTEAGEWKAPVMKFLAEFG